VFSQFLAAVVLRRHSIERFGENGNVHQADGVERGLVGMYGDWWGWTETGLTDGYERRLMGMDGN